jgi:DNA replication protein DnaC
VSVGVGLKAIEAGSSDRAPICLQLISCHYKRGPMILTSNQSFAAWADVFAHCVTATAFIDRLSHHAVTLGIPWQLVSAQRPKRDRVGISIPILGILGSR